MSRDISLRTYIETEILPLYDNFDKAHGRDHARAVMEQSQSLAEYYDVDRDMLYARPPSMTSDSAKDVSTTICPPAG